MNNKEQIFETSAPPERLVDPLAELLSRVQSAYAAYLEAQKEVASAYGERKEQVERAYKQAEQQANNACEKAIDQASSDVSYQKCCRAYLSSLHSNTPEAYESARGA